VKDWVATYRMVELTIAARTNSTSCISTSTISPLQQPPERAVLTTIHGRLDVRNSSTPGDLRECLFADLDSQRRPSASELVRTAHGMSPTS
jgi:hypothetical protein